MDNQVKELENGIKYISNDFLSFGDYDNSCAVERANVRWLIEHEDLKDSIEHFSFSDWNNGQIMKKRFDSIGMPDWYWESIDTNEMLVVTIGGYNSKQVWVREDKWDELELDSLHDYPAMDDELVSRIEMEMEEECWESWIKSDLIRTLSDELTEEQLGEQTCECINCEFIGKVNELANDLVYDEICPKCNSHYTIKKHVIDTKTLNEFANELEDETLYEIYRNCCELTNTNGYCESGGNWYIDINALKDEFKHAIECLYRGMVKCINCDGKKQVYNSYDYRDCELCNGMGYRLIPAEENSNE